MVPRCPDFQFLLYPPDVSSLNTSARASDSYCFLCQNALALTPVLIECCGDSERGFPRGLVLGRIHCYTSGYIIKYVNDAN